MTDEPCKGDWSPAIGSMGYRNWGHIRCLEMDEKRFMDSHVFRNPEFPSAQKNIVFLENREFTYFHNQFYITHSD